MFYIYIHANPFAMIYRGKMQRSSPRAWSISFSPQAIVRRIGDDMYFYFRLVEQRKLQICEAHVRCYAIQHKTREDGVPLLFQHSVMRLTQPDDELGGMVFLLLPSEVYHPIDAWSPILPPSCLPTASSHKGNSHKTLKHDPMYAYRYVSIIYI
jgi:hypothetical protein